MDPPLEKHSCVNCARRKVKCNKLRPCSTCSKAQSECRYLVPVASQRHRKRPADGDLLAKLSEYEGLLREHNIKFNPLDNSWIPSPLVQKLVSEQSTAPSAQKNSTLQVQTPKEAEGQQSKPQSASKIHPEPIDGQGQAAHLWSALSKDLREPPIDQLRRRVRDAKDRPIEQNYNFGLVLLPINFSTAPNLLELHPEPRHVFKLWQTFTEKVNPLIKIVHTPSLQQRILEVSWNIGTVPKPLEAVMFSVYALAITAMNMSDCVQVFGEARSVLLNRYRSAAAQALIAAGMHTTRDLEVLQALVLFVLVEPRSDASVTVLGATVRIGHKMGLHRTGTDPNMSFFEQEMRLRLWWQIRCLDRCSRSSALRLAVPRSDWGNVRIPLNVNDADLHPHMTGPPAVTYTGPTEMLYCLTKYEVANWLRTSPTVSGRSYEMMRLTTPEGMERKRKALAELQNLYEEKYLSYCDARIPLHHITATMAHLLIHRARFNGLQPRHQPEGGRQMSQAEQDCVFESALRLLELDMEVRTSSFSPQLLERILNPRLQIDALVYILSELRQRVSGNLVDKAWAQLGRMHEDHPELAQTDGKFYMALADLTLEAWEARRQELQTDGTEVIVPGFITTLQVARRKIDADSVADMSIQGMISEGEEQYWLLDDEFVDWGSCNEYFQF